MADSRLALDWDRSNGFQRRYELYAVSELAIGLGSDDHVGHGSGPIKFSKPTVQCRSL
jgi:hypothetical protein